METYPIRNSATGGTVAFEVDVDLISTRSIAALLASVPAVTAVTHRKMWIGSPDVYVTFHFGNHDYEVWEPFGDNSRYRIGPHLPSDSAPDIAEIEQVFTGHHPHPLRAVISRVFGFLHL